MEIRLTSPSQCENIRDRCGTLVCWRSVPENALIQLTKMYIFFWREFYKNLCLHCYFICWCFRYIPGHEWANFTIKQRSILYYIYGVETTVLGLCLPPTLEVFHEMFSPSSDHSTCCSLCWHHSCHILHCCLFRLLSDFWSPLRICFI